ncbi:hypothetical protein ACHAXR_002882 [Thalassiosira sp. AJA248-18]
MTMGKSAAKIRRNMARAAARGETYTPPEPANKAPPSNAADDDGSSGDNDRESDQVIQKKSTAAQKLEETLATLESNPNNLNAKERRSAKRKAEAIAAEESGCDDVAELMEWYTKRYSSKKKDEASTNAEGGKKKRNKNTNSQAAAIEKLSDEDKEKLQLAKQLHETLAKLEKDDATMNAKERRSAKRKAEAIASEEAGGIPAKELLEWYETLCPFPTSDESKKKIPYIVFVGQLSYTTTSDMIFQHFQSTLGASVISSKDDVKIRLLTDDKKKGNNKSRGMAFVELQSPEVMYECLKMHLTYLDGRRINVERSAGGGATAKKARITTYRESQTTYISQTMDSILSSFIKNGEITPEEFDEGVISLCKRHSATVVEAALKEYVEEKKERKIKKETLGEKEEEDFRNPSAFLTHMLGRIAEEGVGKSSRGRTNNTGGGGGRGGGRDGGGRGGGPGRGSGGRGGRGRGGGGGGGGHWNDSILQNSGVDMGISSRGTTQMSQLFPSMTQRGRGRGRGYM